MLNFSKNKSINSLIKSSQPQMNSTLQGWQNKITLIKITQDVIDGDLQTTETQITFQGVIQPLSAEQLALRPEGQRSFEHLWIHAVASQLNLETADKIKFKNKRYKIIEKKDYGLNSFVEYMLIRDYEDTEVISDEDN